MDEWGFLCKLNNMCISCPKLNAAGLWQATVGAIAATGVTHVSVGAVTHSVIALDISLKVKIV